MLKHKRIEDQKMQKAKKIIAQQKYSDARNISRKQMMQEETVDDDEDDDRERPRRGRAIRTPQVKMMGQTDDNVNDTYADFDEESPDKDVSETREEYDSEEEKD
jgi:hypothetical protein